MRRALVRGACLLPAVLCALLLAAPAVWAQSAPVQPRAAALISPSQLFDWAQLRFPELFPPGPPNQTLSANGVSYTVRFYPGTGNYLGVGLTDQVVYGLGPFTGQKLLSFGALADFNCDVLKTCTQLRPDADGNLGAGALGDANITLRAGSTLTVLGLNPLDSVVEVNSGSLTGAQLCSGADLPAGAARPVTLVAPGASTLYPTNEFSGPYRSYPAGIYVLSPLSEDCGLVEHSNGQCTAAAGEGPVASQARPGGGTDALCSVSATAAACVKGRVMDATWADPAVQGVFLRLSWNDLQPSGYGQYDWTMLDRELGQALRHGKTVTLGIRVGGNSIPDWVFDVGDPQLGKAQRIELRDWGTGSDDIPDGNCGPRYVVASPADAAFRSLFKKALGDLLAHLRADWRRYAVVAGIKVTGLAQHTLENRLPKRCNIARPNPALGDTGTQGHIVSLGSSSLASPQFDPDYSRANDPAYGRVRDVGSCVCNPQVLAYHGYRPSTVKAFYDEVEATLRAGIGAKQMVFMNISDGFPRVGEAGRFDGDHLVGPIVAATPIAGGLLRYSTGTPQASRAATPADIPGANDITALLLEAGRNGDFAPGQANAARQFGVENAALQTTGFSRQSGVKCSQQVGIATSGAFSGSASFPIAAGTTVDNNGLGCPNFLAVKEGVAHDKLTGFQVVSGIGGALEIDESLWNMTLNTNGVFYEYYERDNWLARKQSAHNAGAVLNTSPAVRSQSGTPNASSATAKSAQAWNQLLLARAAAFSADVRHQNLYQTDPFPSSYSLTVAAAPLGTRYFFNPRACGAFLERGVPVRVNRVELVN